VQGVGLPWVGLKDLSVDVLCRLQPASTMVLHSGHQSLVNAAHDLPYGDAAADWATSGSAGQSPSNQGNQGDRLCKFIATPG
jgi:hypothetical protein